MSATQNTVSDYIKQLVEWRSTALEEIKPLEEQMRSLVAKTEAAKKRLSHFDGLLAIEGWTDNGFGSSKQPEQSITQEELSPQESDYSGLARKWVIMLGEGTFTTSDFAKWLEEQMGQEPSRNSIRNAFQNLVTERLIEVKEPGKGRRSTVYCRCFEI